MPKSVILSQQDQAALAGGADIDTLAHQEVSDDEDAAAATALAEGEEGAAAASASADDDAGAGDEDAAAAAATAAAASAADAEDATGAAGLLTQLGTLTTANANLTVENTRMAAELEVANTSLTGLTAVAIEATHKMQIALKSEPLDMTGLPPSTILAQYNRVKESFESTFKVGQQSASAADDQPDSTVTLPSLGIVRKAQQ